MCCGCRSRGSDERCSIRLWMLRNLALGRPIRVFVRFMLRIRGRALLEVGGWSKGSREVLGALKLEMGCIAGQGSQSNRASMPW